MTDSRGSLIIGFVAGYCFARLQSGEFMRWLRFTWRRLERGDSLRGERWEARIRHSVRNREWEHL